MPYSGTKTLKCNPRMLRSALNYGAALLEVDAENITSVPLYVIRIRGRGINRDLRKVQQP